MDPEGVGVLAGRVKGGNGVSGSLSFQRISPAEFTGALSCERVCLLVQEETFNPLWHLNLDGVSRETAMLVNITQNGFAVPPGRHTFTLSFELPALNRALLVIGNYSWVIFGVTSLTLFLQGLIMREKTQPRVGTAARPKPQPGHSS